MPLLSWTPDGLVGFLSPRPDSHLFTVSAAHKGYRLFSSLLPIPPDPSKASTLFSSITAAQERAEEYLRDWLSAILPLAMQTLATQEEKVHLLDCNAYGRQSLEYSSIIKAFAENRIVSVQPCDDAAGYFEVREMCDEYFIARLTRAQLLAWSDELRTMAIQS
jgi:hypothetical protein